jgi:uncharacterized protein (DUF305 family)
MAKLAVQRTDRRQIKQLARGIISTQNAEMERLQTLNRRLQQAGVEPGDLAMPAHERGMAGDPSGLREAKPFDREFIDMMIAHHQGAIGMARMELKRGDSAPLKELAQKIIDAQADEIDEMNTWRVNWFGALSPAGGVPPAESAEHSAPGM